MCDSFGEDRLFAMTKEGSGGVWPTVNMDLYTYIQKSDDIDFKIAQ